MRVLAALVVLSVVAVARVDAQGCRTTIQGMSVCKILNGISTNASAMDIQMIENITRTSVEHGYNDMLKNFNYSRSTTCKSRFFDFMCAITGKALVVCDAQGQSLNVCYEMCGDELDGCLPTSPPLPRGAMCNNIDVAAKGSRCFGTAGVLGMLPPPPAPPPASSAATTTATAWATLVFCVVCTLSIQ